MFIHIYYTCVYIYKHTYVCICVCVVLCTYGSMETRDHSWVMFSAATHLVF